MRIALKALAVLAIFGVLVCAYYADATANPASQTKASQQPTQPTPPAAAPQGNNGATLQYNSSPEDRQGDPHPVKVILPPNDRYYYIGFGANIVLVIATIFAGVFVCIQAIETRKAAKATVDAVKAAETARKLAEDTAKRQLRAYMVVKKVSLFINKDRTTEVKLELSNCGQTPAYDLRGVHTEGFDIYPIKDPGTPLTPVRMSQNIIGAGLTFRARFKCPESWDDIQAKVTTASSQTVYRMNGYFTFRDVFKDNHFLKFQMIIGGPAGKPHIETDKFGAEFVSFLNDALGNEAD